MLHISCINKSLIISLITLIFIGGSFFAVFAVTQAYFNNDLKCGEDGVTEESVVKNEEINKPTVLRKTRTPIRRKRSGLNF